MRLLVSVRNAAEAAEAIDGGADIVDAKEPAAGALGTVALQTFEAIARTVGGTRLLTAALGDAADEDGVRTLAGAFTAAGADLVKVGLAGTSDGKRATALLASAAAAAGSRRVVAVAYADHWRAGSPAPADVVRVAARLRLAGILLDTADKQAARLCRLLSPPALAEWVESAHHSGLVVAIAGKLTAEDVAALRSTPVDIVGVRGAACEGGRTGRVSAARVRLLRDLMAGREAAGAGT
jgi:uncharacterized protein (UPF0264 family)